MRLSQDGRYWTFLILTVQLASAIPSPPPLILKKGSNATLTCPGHSVVSDRCYWLHEDHVINATENCDQLEWERGNCSLRILNARAEVHEGTWQCVAANASLPLPFQVIVREPCTLQLSISRRTGYLARTSDGHVAVTTGTQIAANCSASGLRPGDSLQWTKVMPVGRNHSLASKEERRPDHLGTVVVQVVTQPTLTDRDDQARLVCTVTDRKARVMFSKEVRLEVFFGPQYTAERSSSMAHANMEVSLACPLHSHPRATYRWFFLERNGLWLEMSGQTRRHLLLDSVTTDQAGFYNCSASNSFLGQNYSASELLHLNVLKDQSFRPPKSVCTMRGRVREHVTLLCPTSTPTFTRTRWFFQGDDRRWVSVTTRGPTLTLLDVKPNQAGLYKCVAGEGKASDGCAFIYLSLGKERMVENLENVLGLAFCAIGAALFVGLLAFVVQISKIKAVLRVQERQNQLIDDQAAVWTSEKVGLPYYSLPPAYSSPEPPAPVPNNAI